MSEVFVNRVIKLGALIDFLSALNSDLFIYETYQHQLKILQLSQLRRQKSQSFLNCCGESCYSLVAVETCHIWDQAGQLAGEVQVFLCALFLSQRSATLQPDCCSWPNSEFWISTSYRTRHGESGPTFKPILFFNGTLFVFSPNRCKGILGSGVFIALTPFLWPRPLSSSGGDSDSGRSSNIHLAAAETNTCQ